MHQRFQSDLHTDQTDQYCSNVMTCIDIIDKQHTRKSNYSLRYGLLKHAPQIKRFSYSDSLSMRAVYQLQAYPIEQNVPTDAAINCARRSTGMMMARQSGQGATASAPRRSASVMIGSRASVMIAITGRNYVGSCSSDSSSRCGRGTPTHWNSEACYFLMWLQFKNMIKNLTCTNLQKKYEGSKK